MKKYFFKFEFLAEDSFLCLWSFCYEKNIIHDMPCWKATNLWDLYWNSKRKSECNLCPECSSPHCRIVFSLVRSFPLSSRDNWKEKLILRNWLFPHCEGNWDIYSHLKIFREKCMHCSLAVWESTIQKCDYYQKFPWNQLFIK